MSEEYDWWTTPNDENCQQDPDCIICGNGDPEPYKGGAVQEDPDEEGHLPSAPY